MARWRGRVGRLLGAALVLAGAGLAAYAWRRAQSFEHELALALFERPAEGVLLPGIAALACALAGLYLLLRKGGRSR